MAFLSSNKLSYHSFFFFCCCLRRTVDSCSSRRLLIFLLLPTFSPEWGRLDIALKKRSGHQICFIGLRASSGQQICFIGFKSSLCHQMFFKILDHHQVHRFVLLFSQTKKNQEEPGVEHYFSNDFEIHCYSSEDTKLPFPTEIERTFLDLAPGLPCCIVKFPFSSLVRGNGRALNQAVGRDEFIFRSWAV
ncbi:hypothetical protein CDAR_527671 [Caerostris darwini]|uniref:Uncharacterized protein n=1 Tax=Caerostris darwini TaxID=1538125 RepID=A0AAV4RBX6_9ARAC|nr:hypothetical protein CDAR_527671 [Caerostris darwini]